MTAVRRSTRLSNLGVATPPPAPQSTATSTSSSSLWRRRQTQTIVLESDDEAEVTIFNEHEKENETANEMNIQQRQKRVQAKENTSTVNIESGLRTPRSSKKDVLTMSGAAQKRPNNKKRAAVQSNESDSDESEHDALHISPPKQSRQHKPMAQHLLTPTRLLYRLSIDDDEHRPQNCDSSSDSETDSDPKARTGLQPRRSLSPVQNNKYQNARRVLNSAETEQLPGREQQLQELRQYFSEHLKEQRSGSMYISGQPGTGKTACLSLLLRSPEFKNKFQRVYINCTAIASVGAIFKMLTAELNLQPAGRTERDHLAAVQYHLCHSKRMVLIVLDEIDQLCTTKQSVLYTIFEWPAMRNAKVLLVGIANSLDLTDRMLMRLNARCELKPRLMHFPPYTKQQIVEIFRSRLQEADVLDIFPPVTLQLLAAKVSAVSGDVRRALDIGRRVVDIAERQKMAGQKEFDLKTLNLPTSEDAATKPQEPEALKPVQVTQVAEVLNSVYGAAQNLDDDLEEGTFPLQQKLMLCSLMLMLRKERNKDITMGRLHEVYRRVCTKRNILALDQAEFVGLVDLVQTRGILRIVRKKEPRLSKVQLQWDEDEVNGALSDKQLIASILDDTACLTRA